VISALCALVIAAQTIPNPLLRGRG